MFIRIAITKAPASSLKTKVPVRFMHQIAVCSMIRM
ncbi:MAG: hypothetical protein M2R46_04992 [Verrucomicrobia subdivision 3 bacterium]|nr:hypothetical protein [Limisphaerales bacterium]